jgi:cytidyltransferase-like protein
MPRVIYTAGCFDLLHRGHVNLLWRSKQLGDVLVVGVVDGDGVKAYKGRFPVENFQLRKSRIERLAFVDVVVRQATTDPTENLERFQPDVMTHGDDWSRLREGHETLERLGVEFVTLPYTPGVSTTVLREKSESRFAGMMPWNWPGTPETVTR